RHERSLHTLLHQRSSISSHLPDGTFSIVLCEFCVAAMIFSGTANVPSVPNSNSWVKLPGEGKEQ
ncbi:MAG: hypothetical protein WBF01_03615, partial [Candidatus Acidiferrum sp.]